ncbi:MAG TPA: hypothetical protein PLN95_03365 [Candidatus Saccharibacteria bacterium]|nr:hypothetical protein [Candidatus Saccharibacteria bacterium]
MCADEQVGPAVTVPIGSHGVPAAVTRLVDTCRDGHVDDRAVRLLHPELVVDLSVLQAVRRVTASGRVQIHPSVAVEVGHDTRVSVDAGVLGSGLANHLRHDGAGQGPVEGSGAVLREQCTLVQHVASDRHIVRAVTVPVTLADVPGRCGAKVDPGFGRPIDYQRTLQRVGVGGRGGTEHDGSANERCSSVEYAISHFSSLFLGMYKLGLCHNIIE